MKLKELIKKLQKLEDKYKDVDVIVDFERYEGDGEDEEGQGAEYGFYDLEEVQVVTGASKEHYINLKSSNEM